MAKLELTAAELVGVRNTAEPRRIEFMPANMNYLEQLHELIEPLGLEEERQIELIRNLSNVVIMEAMRQAIRDEGGAL